MRIRMAYNKIKKNFDSEVQEFTEELVSRSINFQKELIKEADKTFETLPKLYGLCSMKPLKSCIFVGSNIFMSRAGDFCGALYSPRLVIAFVLTKWMSEPLRVFPISSQSSVPIVNVPSAMSHSVTGTK